MLNKYDGVLFDMDGTLVDSYYFHAKSIHDCLKGNGYNVSIDNIKQSIGNTMDLVLTRCDVSKEEQEAIVEVVDEYYRQNIKQNPKLVKFQNGALELLQYLKSQNVKTGIVTNSKEYLVKEIVKMNDAIALFDIVDGACRTSLNKKNRCNQVIKRLKLKNVLYVGDTIHDIELANHCNMDECIIRDSIGWAPDYDELINTARPMHVFNNLLGVKTLF